MKPTNINQLIVITIIVLVTVTALFGNHGDFVSKGLPAISLWVVTLLAVLAGTRRPNKQLRSPPSLTILIFMLIALCAVISVYLIAVSSQPLFATSFAP